MLAHGQTATAAQREAIDDRAADLHEAARRLQGK
jgi:hypothetical protein